MTWSLVVLGSGALVSVRLLVALSRPSVCVDAEPLSPPAAPEVTAELG